MMAGLVGPNFPPKAYEEFLTEDLKDLDEPAMKFIDRK